MIENENIICFGFAEWDNPFKTNQHHLMERISKKNKVLFIESLGLRRPVIQKKDIMRIFKRIQKWFKGTRKINENLYVFAPMVIPFHKYKMIRKFNNWFLKKQLDIIVYKHNFSRPVIWSYIPNAVEFLGRWNEKASIYHCVDELSANPLIPSNAVKNMEDDFLSKVNIVFTTALSLYKSKKEKNSSTYYMPNVADFNHFNSSILPETKISGDIAEIPSPIIGFIGAISNYKLDFDLLVYLAQKHPEWSIVLIGPAGEGEKEADLSLFKNIKNIYFLGSRQYSSLPFFLKAFNVCILPNKLNEYTRNMFPMKFFEYLAAGKPVVATKLDALMEFGDYCYLSKDKEEFEANILKALKEIPQQEQEKRISLARRFTWENRLEEMSKIIIEKFNND